MRQLPLLCLALPLALLAGCASPTAAPAANENVRPSKTAAAGKATANLLVISAVYGSGDKFVDVTYRVNNLLRDSETVFWARPRWLGADPTPGWNKALVIVYEHEGRRRTFSVGEGGEVSVARLSDAAKERTARVRAAKKPKTRPVKASGKEARDF